MTDPIACDDEPPIELPAHLAPHPTELPRLPDGRIMRPNLRDCAITPGFRRAGEQDLLVTRRDLLRLARRLAHLRDDVGELAIAVASLEGGRP